MRQLAYAGSARSFNYGPRTGGDAFALLFSVTFTHTYYTQNNGLCPDFRVVPTPGSAVLMAGLGMLCRSEPTGFSVLIRPDDVPNLIACIRRNALHSSGQSGFWSRLTFQLVLTEPLFVEVTALPMDTKPTQVNLFGCNTQAHLQAGSAVLSQGDFMGGDALYQIVGAEVPLSVPAETKRIAVADISGTVVQEQRILPAGPPAGGDVTVYLDLANLPYDLYTIGIETVAGRPIGAPGYPRTMLFVPQQPVAMGLLDILFTQPEPDSAGVYPLAPLFAATPPGAAAMTNVAYVLPFDARSTYWQYYVVSQNPADTLVDLRIEGSGVAFRKRKQPVTLPDGSAATVFVSQAALPLQQKSTQRFRLTGRRQTPRGEEHDLLVSRLPVAPGSPVWPGPSARDAVGRSEMFVYV